MLKEKLNFGKNQAFFNRSSTKLGENNPISLESYIDEAATYEYVFENQNGNYIFKGLRQM